MMSIATGVHTTVAPSDWGVGRTFFERKSEILSVTGLRGIAVLVVILAHYVLWCAPYGDCQEFRARLGG